jgi:hypothetical protein
MAKTKKDTITALSSAAARRTAMNRIASMVVGAMTPADIVEKVKRCGVSLRLNRAGTGLSLSADNAPPQDIVDLICDARDVLVSHLQEQRAIRAWIDDDLTAGNLDVCVNCGGPWLADYESIFVVRCVAGYGFVHETCSAAWEAKQDRRARQALGFT